MEEEKSPMIPEEIPPKTTSFDLVTPVSSRRYLERFVPALAERLEPCLVLAPFVNLVKDPEGPIPPECPPECVELLHLGEFEHPQAS